MNRRQLLVGTTPLVCLLAGCVSARRSARLVFDSIPPERPDTCSSGPYSIQFPDTYDDASITAFVQQYERERQAADGVDVEALAIDVILTSWGRNYIADLAIRGTLAYNAAYYVGERLITRTESDSASLPPDPRDGEVLECRQRRPRTDFNTVEMQTTDS